MWKIRRDFVKTLKQINKDNFEKEHKNTEESLFDHKDDHNDDHNSIQLPLYWETFDVDENEMQFIENDDEKSIELSTFKIFHHEDSIGRILPEFNILKEVDRLMASLELGVHVEDGNALLHPNLSTTKIQFSRGLLEYFEQTNTFGRNRTLLVNFLANTTQIFSALFWTFLNKYGAEKNYVMIFKFLYLSPRVGFRREMLYILRNYEILIYFFMVF
jgi:hypothetical protein